MKKKKYIALSAALLLAILSCRPGAGQQETQQLSASPLPKKDSAKTAVPVKETDENGTEWEKLEEGLWFAEIASPVKSQYNDSKIRVLKIFPSHYDLELICAAAEKENEAKTVDVWCKEKNLLVAFNAGMFDGTNAEGIHDSRTNRGLMINYDYINNGKLSANKYQKAVLAFNPKDKSLPPVQIYDLTCVDWNTVKNKYHTYSQGLRLVDCHEKNCWKVDNRMWSMVIIAIDTEGSVLFIMTRSPYNMRQFIDIVLSLKLKIHNAMYLEGGPETSFYFDTGTRKEAHCGSYETGFNEDDNNKNFWIIPNIIGIRKKGM